MLGLRNSPSVPYSASSPSSAANDGIELTVSDTKAHVELTVNVPSHDKLTSLPSDVLQSTPVISSQRDSALSPVTEMASDAKVSPEILSQLSFPCVLLEDQKHESEDRSSQTKEAKAAVPEEKGCLSRVGHFLNDYVIHFKAHPWTSGSLTDRAMLFFARGLQVTVSAFSGYQVYQRSNYFLSDWFNAQSNEEAQLPIFCTSVALAAGASLFFQYGGGNVYAFAATHKEDIQATKKQGAINAQQIAELQVDNARLSAESKGLKKEVTSLKKHNMKLFEVTARQDSEIQALRRRGLFSQSSPHSAVVLESPSAALGSSDATPKSPRPNSRSKTD